MSELTIIQALNLAAKKHNEGKLQEAEIIYRKILDKDPFNHNAIHLLGLIAYQVNRYEEAIKYINKAIELKPDAIYYGNLAMAYDKLGKEEESAKNFIKALSINPAYDKAYLAHYNLGVYFKENGKIFEALEHYNKAIELDNNFFEAHWNKSLILLLLGKFDEGWKEYDYRFKKENPTDSRIFNKPKWDGSSLNGKKILIVSEQGFGDNIQFIRYIPLIKEKKGYIILECRKELKILFKNLFNIDEFIDKENIVHKIEFDFYIHLMNLPMLFKTNLDNIPNKIPYLEANTEISTKLKEKLNTHKFKIGIAWKGNPEQANDKNRSTTLDKFKLLNIPGISLFSLQKNAEENVEELNSYNIIDLANYINDFADTASIINNLDLVVSVDTSIAHLAGALGKPVWTLLSFIPDWRWMLNRNDSPWYPNMKLFRQTQLGDWDSVFKKAVIELKDLINKKEFY